MTKPAVAASWCVKFLVDECLTPDVAGFLVAAGHDAVHVRDLDLLGGSDLAVMAAAIEANRVVISADTDFGELLAKGGRSLPSVILLRRRHDSVRQSCDVRAGRHFELLLGAGRSRGKRTGSPGFALTGREGNEFCFGSEP